MAINSKNKGSEFERKVAKLLTEWAGSEFHRTPMSGALHWSNDKRVVSDIVPPQELVDKGWPFSIECKKVEDAQWEFSNFIEGNSMTLKDHWKQCCDDAKREDMIPMMIFSKNRRDTFVMITKETLYQLEIEPECYINVVYKEHDLVILKFSDFLSSISIGELMSKNLLAKKL